MSNKNLKLLLFSGVQVRRNEPHYEYCESWLREFISLRLSGKENVFLISWAVWGGHTADQMFSYARETWEKRFNLPVKPFHKESDYPSAISKADALIMNAGSIHMLVNTLEKNHLMEAIKGRVHSGCWYIGTSAGAVVAGPTMHTASEPPFIHIPSHKTLHLLPFQISAHYFDIHPDNFFPGATPEMRIKNYLSLNPEPHPVLALQDGSFVTIIGDKITLHGTVGATVFAKTKERFDFTPGDDLSELFDTHGRFYRL